MPGSWTGSGFARSRKGTAEPRALHVSLRTSSRRLCAPATQRCLDERPCILAELRQRRLMNVHHVSGLILREREVALHSRIGAEMAQCVLGRKVRRRQIE